MTDKEYDARNKKKSELKKNNDENKESKGSEDKERINYRRSATPVPEDENRILKEVQESGQAIETKQGTVRFVDRKKGIEARDYYHGLLPCEDIKYLLKKNGDFCVRITEIKSGEDRQMCLSVRWENKLRHFLLHSTSNKTWSLDLNLDKSPQFSSIEGLIDFYSDYKQPFSEYNCRLFTPVQRHQWEFRHAQIELESKLGEGAFGEVYSGFVNTRTKRNKAAIKTMKCEHVTKDKIEESMAEARLMRRLSHPNVVRFFGVAAEDEPIMIVMEFVKGGSLDGFLEKEEDIDADICITMCLDASRGLEYLHSKGILHRDLASRNCLYAKPTLKISDFGMARAAVEYRMVPNERAPVRWMAPEVLLTKIHTPPSDVWSLGVLFWEIFNHAQEPYEGWPFGKVKKEVTKNNYHLSLPDSAPEVLKELMKKIWVIDPTDRISSKQVARILETICPGAESAKEYIKKGNDSFELEATGEDQEIAEDDDDEQNKTLAKVARKIIKEDSSQMDSQGKLKIQIENKAKKPEKSEESKSKASRPLPKMKNVEVKLKVFDMSTASVRRRAKQARHTSPADDEVNQSSKKKKKKKTLPSNPSSGLENQMVREEKSIGRGRNRFESSTPHKDHGDSTNTDTGDISIRTKKTKNARMGETSTRSKKLKKKKSSRKLM